MRYEKHDCNRAGDSGHYDDRTASKRLLSSEYSDECESAEKSLNELSTRSMNEFGIKPPEKGMMPNGALFERLRVERFESIEVDIYLVQRYRHSQHSTPVNGILLHTVAMFVNDN